MLLIDVSIDIILLSSLGDINDDVVDVDVDVDDIVDDNDIFVEDNVLWYR